jgi:hypothetical protein
MADSSIDLASPTGNADTRTQPGGDHRQVVNVGDPTATDVAAVTTANGLAVDVTRIAAGTNHIGEVAVNLIANKAPDFGAGNVTSNTFRMIHAADDPAINKDIGAGDVGDGCSLVYGSGHRGHGRRRVTTSPISISIRTVKLAPAPSAIKDGSGSAFTIFPGGTNSVSNLVPFRRSFSASTAASAGGRSRPGPTSV